MLVKYFVPFVTLALMLTGCEEDREFKLQTPKKISIAHKLTLNIEETNGKPLDSVIFFLDGKRVASKNNSVLNLSDAILGIHGITARVYFEGKEKKLSNRIYFLAPHKPKIYTYEIVNSYPHDPAAFTQGFEYYNGFLYESTGQNGESSIRKTEIKTGKVLKIIPLDAKYFGEGITIFDNKIHQLTWKAGIGFIYDLDSFEKIGEFSYGKSKEGWGLSHNGKELIKSDGTERIWFLDPETHREKHFIEAYTNKRKAESLNEIEYIDGLIYANIWQKNTIIIINAQNGIIEGVVNLNGLKSKISQPDKTKPYTLNGIAYDKENKRLFVTGKNWDKTFEIKLKEK